MKLPMILLIGLLVTAASATEFPPWWNDDTVPGWRSTGLDTVTVPTGTSAYTALFELPDTTMASYERFDVFGIVNPYPLQPNIDTLFAAFQHRPTDADQWQTVALTTEAEPGFDAYWVFRGFAVTQSPEDWDDVRMVLSFDNSEATTVDWNVQLVPEPAALALLGVGAVTLTRRRKHGRGQG